MQRADELFTESDRKEIADAVAEAERGTSAEIVPVVATVSGGYDRAEDVCGLLCGLLGVAVLWTFQGVEWVEGAWAPTLEPSLGLLPVLGVFLAASVGGAWLASRVPLLRRPFIPASVMRAEVQRAAELAFRVFRVRRTAAATGLVLYVSLYERKVCVLGDDAVAAKLGPTDWGSVRDAVLAGLGRGDPTGGLVAGIRTAGELLRPHVPAGDGDADELHNELRLLA